MKGTVDFNGWIRVDVILSGAAGRVLDIITETLLLALGITVYRRSFGHHHSFGHLALGHAKIPQLLSYLVHIFRKV